MAYGLGGRAAEQLIFGKISTGALSDLEKITKQAYAMVSYFGMSERVGHISFYDSSGQADFGFTKPYSEKTAELIDREVNQIIAQSYIRVQVILQKNVKGLKELAELLLEKEVIFSEDLERIFGKKKSDLVKESRDSSREERMEEKKTTAQETATEVITIKEPKSKKRTKKSILEIETVSKTEKKTKSKKDQKRQE